MGRSKWVNQSLKEDPNSSSKKQKTPPDTHGEASAREGENIPGENLSERGKTALYHCNYCDKDVTFTVRIRCAVCPDFDLCVECFSVGAQLTPHSSNHPYRVMENLSFPLLSPDWNIDEEILLLEGLAMYGFGNWNEVAEHICTKTRTDSIDHYYKYYMNSPCFPLPDLSHVMGKTKDELIVASSSFATTKQEIPSINDTKLSEESSFLPPIDIPRSDMNNATVVMKKENVMAGKKGERLNLLSDLDIKQRKTGDKGDDDVLEMHGYNRKREEFEVEYDNDAENILADMEFSKNDTDCEREMKLRVLRIYSKRLDERKRRQSFVVERNVLREDPFVKREEKEIYERLKVFARFHSKEEHEELVRAVAEERRIIDRIRDIQEARAAGLRTSGELKCFVERKRGEQKTTGDDCWDLCGVVGAELLSEEERKICSEMRMVPAQFLHIAEVMSEGILKKSIGSKEEARRLFNADSEKVDKIHDMLVAKGFGHRKVS